MQRLRRVGLNHGGATLNMCPQKPGLGADRRSCSPGKILNANRSEILLWASLTVFPPVLISGINNLPSF